MQWLWIPAVAVTLVLFRLLSDRDKREEREELVKAIRKELVELKDEILKEIRSK